MIGQDGAPRPTAYAMCGLAFSGKSTAARRIAADLGLALISLDAINTERGLDGGTGLPVAEWERTSHTAMARLADELAAGRSAVVDDTFSHRFLRDRCRAVAASAGADFVLLAMTTPLEVIERRRAANARRPERPAIDDAVFAAHRDGFQHPGDDEAPVRIGGDADLTAWIAAERAARRGLRHGVA